MDIKDTINQHKILAYDCRKNDDKRGIFYTCEEHEQMVLWLEELQMYKKMSVFSIDELHKILEYLIELREYKENDLGDGKKYEAY